MSYIRPGLILILSVLFFHSPAFAQAVLTANDFEYIGAFRPPQNGGGNSDWSYSSGGLGYNTNGDPSSTDDFPGSLIGAGHANDDLVAEITIPEPSATAVQLEDYNALPKANYIQQFFDITIAADGRGSIFEGFSDGGRRNVADMVYLPSYGSQTQDHILWTLKDGYNTSATDYDVLGWSDTTLSNPQARGTWHVGDRDDDVFHSVKTWGYIFDIPESWAGSFLGGENIRCREF